ncbi:MAG: PAS domain S-box protein [Deltaproteobacteria bacterium]|nr:PAS domain S-box protein [Deltaproteobacteria bacterium]MBN2671135.1 PAS domain S-box protein [Deltaproteobacteria bacterium]
MSRETEYALLLHIFETVPIAITVINADGQIVRANSAAEKTLRLTKSQIAQRTYNDPQWEISDFDGNPFSLEKLPFIIVKKTLQPVHNIRHAIRHEDGTVVFLNINGAPQLTPEGEFDGMIASIEDISELVLAHRQAQENEIMLQSIFRASPVGIGMVKDRHLVWTNSKIHEMSGYSAEELTGQSARILYPNEDEFIYVGEEKYRQIGVNGTGTVETKWKNKNGNILDVLLSSTPLNMNNLSEGVIFSAMDISTRVKLEEELRNAEKMRAVGQLAGGIGHDFNNQLAAIMGFADLLDEDKALPKKYKSYTAGILTSAQRAKELTFQLLAFARKGKYLNVSVDVHHLIGDLVGFLNRTVHKNISIVQHLEATRAVIQGDPSLIQNALLNLTVNARDAMPNGGTLTISTSDAHLKDNSPLLEKLNVAAGSYLKISVTDTGKGISDQTVSQIFEPFLTADDKNTGLGLAAVYGTCRNHGGGVDVMSEPDTGNSFSIYLPEGESAAKNARRSLPSSMVPKQDNAVHILVVDDEAIVREMTDSILLSLDYRVTLCCDGEEALVEFKKDPHRFDAVILDIVMPKKDGKSTFFEMKELRPDVKILVASGYSIDQDAQALLSAGAKGFIQKPFRVAQLRDKLQFVLTS